MKIKINYQDPHIQKQLVKIKDRASNSMLFYKKGSPKGLYMICLVDGLFLNFRNINNIGDLKPHISSYINPFDFSPPEYKEIIKTDTVFIVENLSNKKFVPEMIDKMNEHIARSYGEYNRWICKFLNEKYFLIIDTVT